MRNINDKKNLKIAILQLAVERSLQGERTKSQTSDVYEMKNESRALRIYYYFSLFLQ